MTVIKRPYPPESLFTGEGESLFRPAREVGEWVRSEVLEESGMLHNPEHKHLLWADLEFLWAAEGYTQKQRRVVGTAEQVTFRAGGWQKARQEEQMRQWFGRVPTYLITLDAQYAANADDIAWCALVEHELYHVAQAKDEFGAPAFTKEGIPKLCIRGHDVEEFVGVVRRYGIGDPGGAIAQLVAAAKSRPEVSEARVRGACGTCHLQLAAG